MKKRNPLKQYNERRKAPPAPTGEVSFWLVKIDPELMRKIEDRRKLLGQNKKVTVARMAIEYLHNTALDWQ